MSIRRFNRRPKLHFRPATLILILAVCIVAAGFGLRASAWFAPRDAPEAQYAIVAQERPRPVPIARELVTVRPWGFEPTTLSRPTGPFVLEVRNASGLRDMSLRLDKEAGNRLQEKRMLREKLDWSATIDLPAGTYFLTEEGHPSWVYRIAITERLTR